MPGFDHDTLTIVLAVIVGVLSVARTARLLIFDEFPPVTWLRVRFLAMFDDDSKWSKIAECPFCLGPYLAAGMLGWAWACDLHWSWWVVNIWWGSSYLAAIVVSYDEPAG